MKTKDEAFTLSNPRLLTAVYFSLLSIIATIAIDTCLYAFGVGQVLPFFKAIILGVVISAFFGALFGKRIIWCEKPFHLHVFLWAFLMVLLSLPVYNLGFVYFLTDRHPELFLHATWARIAYLYLFTLAYLFILVGLWLAVIAGFAAIYLRGTLVYLILNSLSQKRKNPHGDITTGLHR